MKLSELHINPDNPRIIKDESFKNLVNSIREFPKMMKLRPIVYDNEMMILGGDKRFKALKELKYKEIPDEWTRLADDLTEDEKQRFIILDNLNSGSWDWDILSDKDKWNKDKLSDWGLDLPIFESIDIGDPEIKEKEIKDTVFCPKCNFEFNPKL